MNETTGTELPKETNPESQRRVAGAGEAPRSGAVAGEGVAARLRHWSDAALEAQIKSLGAQRLTRQIRNSGAEVLARPRLAYLATAPQTKSPGTTVGKDADRGAKEAPPHAGGEV